MCKIVYIYIYIYIYVFCFFLTPQKWRYLSLFSIYFPTTQLEATRPRQSNARRKPRRLPGSLRHFGRMSVRNRPSEGLWGGVCVTPWWPIWTIICILDVVLCMQMVLKQFICVIARVNKLFDVFGRHLGSFGVIVCRSCSDLQRTLKWELKMIRMTQNDAQTHQTTC